MDLTVEVKRLNAALEAARDREVLLREQIGILQSTVQVLREQLEAMRADQKEMRGLLASVHGVLTAKYLGEPPARDERPAALEVTRRVEAEVIRPERLEPAPPPPPAREERVADVEPRVAGPSRPEPPRRGPVRAQPPSRTWRDALWGREL